MTNCSGWNFFLPCWIEVGKQLKAVITLQNSQVWYLEGESLKGYPGSIRVQKGCHLPKKDRGVEDDGHYPRRRAWNSLKFTSISIKLSWICSLSFLLVTWDIKAATPDSFLPSLIVLKWNDEFLNFSYSTTLPQNLAFFCLVTSFYLLNLCFSKVKVIG